ncbi:copper amine oxidase N-terminal domain-containing protein [Paenibacillus senegalensis]|uniref:copper amine oxidase N-terminal domain-containing protein n=1 Tax=Paenibacillus senegalensis TaxID=1465766 RepID=UPI000287B4DD|nr:copper amine oxidase N-terminal domain-containing protein [Paenibacillus senegalensis]
MGKKKYIRWFSGWLAAMVLFLTACQGIGGVDLNKALKDNLLLESYEGSGTVSLEISGLNEDWLVEEGVDLSFLQNLRVDFTNMKVQDLETMSSDGVVLLGERKIPFSFSMDKEIVAFDVEGLKGPIYVDASYNEFEDAGLGLEGIEENAMELARSLGGFIIDNFPNPSKVGLTKVQENINGEPVELNKVHLQIKGSEVVDLFKKFIENVLADEEALKGIIEQVYTLVIAPMEGGEAAGLLGDGLAVDQIYQVIKEELEVFSAEIDTLKDDPDLAAIFNDDNYINMDFYVDKQLQIRKSAVELVVVILSDEGPVTVRVASDQDIWNLNGNIAADLLDISKGYSVEDESLTSGFLIANMDRQSDLFKLLDEDLNLRAKSLFLPVWEGDVHDYKWGEPYLDPVTEKTMVPVRLVAEELDAVVEWDNDLRQVNIVDAWTGKTIVLTIGSTTALIDGVETQLEGPAVLTDDTTYVPVRFVAEAFGAEVDWDNEFRAVIIERN